MRAALCGYAAISIAIGIFPVTTSTPRAEGAREGSILPVTQALCNDMKKHNVIKAGAPVGCKRLRLVKFSYLGFDGGIHTDGEIMVMDAAAENVLRIFTRLRGMHYPIAKAKLIDHYDGSDDASIADNNTSAFNFRNVAGTNSLSLHAYGLAIDINPLQNPYVERSAGKLKFSPPAGADYADRLSGQPEKQLRLGLAESVVGVFADEGFVIWGGHWKNAIDYQHFQVSRGLAQQLAGVSPEQARAIYAQQVESYRACRSNGERRSECAAREGAPGNSGKR